jgi:putative restriction endonuclease
MAPCLAVQAVPAERSFLLRQLMFRAAMPTLLGHCAVCRLKRDQLLEVAHIVGDRDERGTPTVTNGIALCSLHHAAFDAHLITVRPDYHVEVSEDVLHETDGPILVHGLQGFNGQFDSAAAGSSVIGRI